ncbi:MAG: hypothetical protein HY078_09820 [Elusimicrobia bacterium]|nr:hypothetical protein [Elusimicrobiota bacterium]
MRRCLLAAVVSTAVTGAASRPARADAAGDDLSELARKVLALEEKIRRHDPYDNEYFEAIRPDQAKAMPCGSSRRAATFPSSRSSPTSGGPPSP